ncbi:Hypothetical predicted protein [Marmota monax]|uniref:Carboxylesterase type B domain-containing protein n=1 Tax=Marmota monax TaxID=9995 RepID=A0A5E4A4Q1_MARMO|nr:Hypothetical predicted protein [Marmota monax]
MSPHPQTLQVLSPLPKILFHRTISESGVAVTTVLLKKDNKPLAAQIAVTAGCKTTTSVVMVHCLRQKTEDELLETTSNMVGASMLVDRLCVLGPGHRQVP